MPIVPLSSIVTWVKYNGLWCPETVNLMCSTPNCQVVNFRFIDPVHDQFQSTISASSQCPKCRTWFFFLIINPMPEEAQPGVESLLFFPRLLFPRSLEPHTSTDLILAPTDVSQWKHYNTLWHPEMIHAICPHCKIAASFIPVMGEYSRKLKIISSRADCPSCRGNVLFWTVHPSSINTAPRCVYIIIKGISNQMQKTIPELEKLREGLSEEEKNIINQLWQYYLDSKDRSAAMPATALYSIFGREIVCAVTDNLGTNIIRQNMFSSDPKKYSLTFVGILLTEQGKEIEHTLINYLYYLKDRLKSEPEMSSVSSQEVNEALKLTDRQSLILEKILALSPFKNGGSSGGNDWTSGLPADIADVFSQDGVEGYFRNKVLALMVSEEKDITMLDPKSLDRNVFIVHGHDEAKKWELKNFLAKLGLEPLILHEQDDRGMTIIEKFEHYASQCRFAFVLLTPDDSVSHPDTQESKWRARQNVIMELGWFMAKLGRERVIIIHKGQVEIPSDMLGIIYLPFRESILEVSEKIRQRLQGLKII